jgi:hypothetical protein
MIDTTLVAAAYVFIVFAALVGAVAVAAIVVALRDLRRTGSTPVLVSTAGPAERTFGRAA